MNNHTTTSTKPLTVHDFALRRIGIVMRQDEHDPREAWGVLNPAVARTTDGRTLLFPRIVADGNYSRIGIAEVQYNDAGDPIGVERQGIALEPDEWFEKNPRTAGVEDPRITRVDALDCWVMAYCAYGPRGPRCALAVSSDLISWRRLGLVEFATERGVQWSYFDNKDIYVFPEPVIAPDGRAAIAVMHRPCFAIDWMGHESAETIDVLPEGVTERRPGMWMSYAALDDINDDCDGLQRVWGHRPVAYPLHDWEIVKIGGGTQPVRISDGQWLSIHHGVSGHLVPGADHQPAVHYRAGIMLHDGNDPALITSRSVEPALSPELAEEMTGIVDHVVFPTALDDRGDGTYDVYYGMADARIGVARLERV